MKLVERHTALLHAAENGGVSPEDFDSTLKDWQTLSGFQANGASAVPRSAAQAGGSVSDSGDGVRLATGIHSGLDRALGGGLRRKELGLLIAPTNHGKTTTLLRTAGHLAEEERTVLYLSFEIYRDQVIERLKQLMGKRLPKALYVEDYPSDEMSVDDVMRVADQVKSLDCLVVDHIDLLRHNDMDLINAHGQAVRRLRGYARKRSCVVWTAAQADDPDPGQLFLLPGQTYGSRQKRHAADIALGSLFIASRRLQTFLLWKTRHTHMGLRFALDADMVGMKFKEVAI